MSSRMWAADQIKAEMTGSKEQGGKGLEVKCKK